MTHLKFARQFGCWLICVLLFTGALSAQKVKKAQATKPESKIWLSLGHSTLDMRTPDWTWLREQSANGKLPDKLAPVRNRLGGIVILVFDDGRTFYETNVTPFAGCGKNAAENEAALRQLLEKAQALKIPVYFGLDLLP